MPEKRDQPDEQIVREQLRDEERRVGDSGPGADLGPDTGTAQDDAAEPAGEQDPANEAERIPEAAGDSGSEVGPGDAQDELTALRAERDKYLELAQRAQADFENYRKRAAKESAAAGDRARGNLVRELLPVVDNLERALAAEGDSDQSFVDGVRLVHSELLAVLQRSGVEAFDPRGEPFDPELHEALSTRPEEGAQPGVVLDVVEKGYRLNGSVLRPARVVVSGGGDDGGGKE